MKHYLFEVIKGDYEGEEFLVGANDYHEAREIAEANFGVGTFRYWHEVSDFEAEMSGLDEY